MKWITDRDPMQADADAYGNILITTPEGRVAIDDFRCVTKDTPWMPLPIPQEKPSTRWGHGLQHNFLTDGEYTVIVSGGYKHTREQIVDTILNHLNKEMP